MISNPESGQYNEWRSSDGRTIFRIAVTGVSSDLHGPNAADAVKAMFEKTIAVLRPNATVNVKTVMVCNGTQPAYRFDDPPANA